MTLLYFLNVLLSNQLYYERCSFFFNSRILDVHFDIYLVKFAFKIPNKHVYMIYNLF